MMNNLIPRLKRFEHDCIYQLIAYQHPALCVDVGAAAGTTTRQIKTFNPKTKVIAFEPFPGNHPYFQQHTKEFERIKLIKKAVSEKCGNATFRVNSVVQGTEPGWEKYAGYSSVGYLELEGIQASATAQEFMVETTTIDAEIGQRIDFMKIDVQGGEFDVLQGSQQTIATHGINVFYIEFDGRDRRVLEFLRNHQYTVFETDYMISPRRKLEFKELEQVGFYDFREIALSTGKTAIRAKLNFKDGDYCAFLEYCLKEFGYAWTDLIAVSPKYLDRFMVNLGKWAAGIDPDVFNLEIAQEQYPAYWGDRVIC